MIGKKDTVAIFESYQKCLIEQDERASASFIARKLLYAIMKNRKDLFGVSSTDIDKLEQYLQSREFETAWNSFQPSAMKEQPSPVEGDASAVNMGEGGVLEVQPDGQYPQ